MTKCPNCNYKIPASYISKSENPSKIKCPKCRKKLKVTVLSAIIFSLLMLIPVIVIGMFLKNFILRVILILLWGTISLNVFRPMIYTFKLEEIKK